MTWNKRSVGTAYESLAADYLKRKGFRILERNFRCRAGEIDLIAREGRSLVFIEVKYRRSRRSGMPEEAVSPAKRRTICRVSDYYRLRKGISDVLPLRYDVLAIEADEIRYYRNAFPYQPF